MIELFLRTTAICFLMEIGSASNFTIAAMASSSNKWLVVILGGVVGILLASLVAYKLVGVLQKLPVSPNIISGSIMIIVGSIYLIKELA